MTHIATIDEMARVATCEPLKHKKRYIGDCVIRKLQNVTHEEACGLLGVIADEITVQGGIGTLVISKDGGVFTPFPGMRQRIANAATAGLDTLEGITQGVVFISDDELRKREAICHACQFYDAGICKSCGCMLQVKTKLASQRCPVGKW